jgi:hypothetical protein
MATLKFFMQPTDKPSINYSDGGEEDKQETSASASVASVTSGFGGISLATKLQLDSTQQI